MSSSRQGTSEKMSSSFSLFSGNTSKTYIPFMPWLISTKLGHKNPWSMALMSYIQSVGQRLRIGHRGQNRQSASPPTHCRVWICDSCIASAWPSRKFRCLKIHSGTFGVTGVKRSFSLKCYNLFLLNRYPIYFNQTLHKIVKQSELSNYTGKLMTLYLVQGHVIQYGRQIYSQSAKINI